MTWAVYGRGMNSIGMKCFCVILCLAKANRTVLNQYQGQWIGNIQTYQCIHLHLFSIFGRIRPHPMKGVFTLAEISPSRWHKSGYDSHFPQLSRFSIVHSITNVIITYQYRKLLPAQKYFQSCRHPGICEITVNDLLYTSYCRFI